MPARCLLAPPAECESGFPRKWWIQFYFFVKIKITGTLLELLKKPLIGECQIVYHKT